MAKSTTEMGRRHERHVNDLLKLTSTPGSGSQFHRQTDGRCEDHELTYRLAQDSKSTLAKSISINFAGWDKLVEQAHPLIPAMPIRRYAGSNLMTVSHDLILVDLADFEEILTQANDHGRYCHGRYDD